MRNDNNLLYLGCDKCELNSLTIYHDFRSSLIRLPTLQLFLLLLMTRQVQVLCDYFA